MDAAVVTDRDTGDPRDRYEFRTPGLLNIELTAPYGHAGQFATLQDMVAHYRNTQNSLLTYNIATHVDDPALVPTLVGNTAQVLAQISPQVENPRNFDTDAIVAFLRALTADSARDLSALTPSSVPSGLSID